MGEGGQKAESEGSGEDDVLAAPHSFTEPARIVQPDCPPLAEVVLYQPQIPQNTGNIGRTCVATGSRLWIVRPMGFRIDEKRVRRAGLDYWQHLRLAEVDTWEELRARLPDKRYWYFSRRARQTIWQADMQPGDVVVLGSESEGLPASLLDPEGPDAVRLPTDPRVRSLNLSSAAAVVLYELLRRRDHGETA